MESIDITVLVWQEVLKTTQSTGDCNPGMVSNSHAHT